MGGFFHGWRRKAGCIALLMACVFAVECALRTQGDWDMICPVDWEYVRYFAIAPLTLLSAYLILWKPRKMAEKPESGSQNS